MSILTANHIITLVCGVFTIGALSTIGYHVWINQDEIVGVRDGVFTMGTWVRMVLSPTGIEITAVKRLGDSLSPVQGLLARNLRTDKMIRCKTKGKFNNKDTCLQLQDGFQLDVSVNQKRYKHSRMTNDLQCLTFSWTPPANSSFKETPEDCFQLSDYHWFGGFEESCQAWPMNGYTINSSAFITADSYMGRVFGSVIDGIFLSSSGLGIIVEETTPLYVSINQGGVPFLCLKGRVGDDTPFFNVSQPFLKYDLCLSTNVLSLWKGISANYIPKPTLVPSYDVLRYPIWCTWAVYKDRINQTIVLDYAKSIREHNFSASQLEIDDSWTPHYGDFNFTEDRFPDAEAMIQNLTELGIPVTVWVHPFFNRDSSAFGELAIKGFLVKELGSDAPHMVSWWRSQHNAGILDVTNQQAVQWYLDKLDSLKTAFNVTSFKFDAGEAIWYPGRYQLKNPVATPNYLSKNYLELAMKSDLQQRRQEMRVGFRSQDSALMMRLIDRQSDWSHTFGIKTLIPAALVFGMMGYPYILPDMIGGDDYAMTSPDPELFIRWLQANVFLPVLQISTPPWMFGDNVTQLTKRYLQLHEDYADTIIKLALNAVETGEPIVRPLWWIAPEDEEALPIDSEFLLGDDLLVAPVLDKGAKSRDIYLPSGTWKDEQTGTLLRGGAWLFDYDAPLYVLPYFTKVA